jgi:hypothetical protein
MFRPDDLLLALTDAKVRFVVIGGVAVGVHGYVRATEDLDVVPDPAAHNLRRLAGLLQELGVTHAGAGDFAQDEFPADPTDPRQLAEGGNFRLETPHGPLDVMQWVPGIDADLAYHQLVEHAVAVGFRDREIRVCGLGDLRLMKQTAGRPRDLDDLAHLPERPGD